jgi:flagellar FliL protein
MADPKESPEGAAPVKKKSSFKLIMILFSLLIFLGAGGVAAYLWIGNPLQSEEAKSSAASSGGKAVAGDPARSNLSVSLKPMVINLADGSYLKVSMTVELNNPDAAPEINRQDARIRDALILLLSSKKSVDLDTAGKLLLKNEVVDRLNQILGVPRVVRIYYTDFEIQNAAAR